MSIQYIPSRVAEADLAATARTVYEDFIAEEDIDIREVVYISSAGSVSLALATGSPQDKAVGLATESKTTGQTIRIRKVGVLSGFTGLSQDVLYYLDPSTAGAITTTVPSGSGESIIKIGLAKSSTELDIDIQILARRS